MLDILVEAAGVLLLWSVACLALAWGHLPAHWRRGLALVSSVAGLVCLSVALNTTGFRESRTTAAFLIGPSYVTGHASASASLPYYVLTGVCLFLGTAGLAASDRAGQSLSRHWLRTAVAFSVFVTLVRFALEKAAAPPLMRGVFGVVWLAPVVGAFAYANVATGARVVRRFLRAMLLYIVAVRGFVALVYVAASTLRLGSHYDVSSVETFSDGRYNLVPGSPTQILVLGVMPQVVFWPVYTLLAGALGAGVAWLAAHVRPPRVGDLDRPVTMAAARHDP
jgi:hypothetical protein